MTGEPQPVDSLNWIESLLDSSAESNWLSVIPQKVLNLNVQMISEDLAHRHSRLGDNEIMASLPRRLEPRWPALLALLAVGGLRLALPEPLSAGPDWLVLALVGLLVIPIVWSRSRGLDNLNRILGYIVTSIVTLDMVWSLYLLVAALPSHKESPLQLLTSAAALWITNILVFASWYWRLDAGGPRARELRGGHTDGAFLFPQMTLSEDVRRKMCEQNWSPNFVDYLFLAFNTSTAFSPTDVPVLTRWAKLMMMVQALISFATVALLAARAVNIL